MTSQLFQKENTWKTQKTLWIKIIKTQKRKPNDLPPIDGTSWEVDENYELFNEEKNRWIKFKLQATKQLSSCAPADVSCNLLLINVQKIHEFLAEIKNNKLILSFKLKIICHFKACQDLSRWSLQKLFLSAFFYLYRTFSDTDPFHLQ